MNYIDKLTEMLKKEEGFRRFPYKDTVGKLTVGFGRNLDNIGISKEEAEILLSNDVAMAEAELRKNIEYYDDLDASTKVVLIDMCFNMGIGKLMQFKKMFSAIKENNKELTAKEMLNSKWATQVGVRAQKLAYFMEMGKI